MRHRGDNTLRRDLTGGSGDAADTRPLNSAAAKRRVCPSIPPAGIGGMRTLTLPDRRSAGAVRGETVCQRPPRLSSLGPRKPQSGEGHMLIDCLSASVSLAGGWQGRRLLPLSGNSSKTQKESAKSRQNINVNKLFALSMSVGILHFSARWAVVIPWPSASKRKI